MGSTTVLDRQVQELEESNCRIRIKRIGEELDNLTDKTDPRGGKYRRLMSQWLLLTDTQL